MAKTISVIAKCKGCNETMQTTIVTEKSVFGRSIKNWGAMFVDTKGECGWIGEHALRCRKCNLARVAKQVKGTYSATHICSAKCTGSRGFVCECSCGGKNHGSAYA